MSSMEERFRYDCSGEWFKGNLHMHTTLSDGGLTMPAAAKFYAERGYDFISITDHMIPFVGAESDDEFPLMVLDGIELDGTDDEGSYYHAVCIGNVGGVTRDMGFKQALEKARSQGSFLIWAHPHWSLNTVAEGMRHGFDGIEIYNSGSQIAFGNGYGTFHWDMVLREGLGMLGFATDDAHFAEAAETSPVEHARLIGPLAKHKYKGAFDRGPMTHTHFRIPDDWTFARLEIEDANGRTAWSNPLLKQA